MRADRLMSIMLMLQSYGKMTTRDLAQKLEVSDRTIMRDMESLSMAGIPVYAERGSSGGWSLSEGYRTQLTGMKPQELMSLLLMKSSSLVDDLGLRQELDNAYHKLLAASPIEMRRDADIARERIHIDGAGWRQTEDTAQYLSNVQQAVWIQHKLRITYERHDSIVIRDIMPLGLVAKRGVWYVVAQVEDGFRSYRISRIRNAEMLNQAFARPDGFDLARYWEESTKQFTSTLPRYPARIGVRDDLLQRLKHERYVKLLQIESAHEGWYYADVEFHTLDSAAQIILGFGSAIEAIQPGELRNKVISEIRNMLSTYEGEQ
ncbi:YafY family protein [Paenibacillus sp. chi10]|uniref:YafY family protein n=1 Tax=Paenibacillus suaedae TaxID=3077233 RepID=A0AAJ2K224_9BACL|nr:YafY family protein [Paenibacillus sp. chi10]MDT8978864.1 YafY family protein [Paenibacillus sp. chi10]